MWTFNRGISPHGRVATYPDKLYLRRSTFTIGLLGRDFDVFAGAFLNFPAAVFVFVPSSRRRGFVLARLIANAGSFFFSLDGGIVGFFRFWGAATTASLGNEEAASGSSCVKLLGWSTTTHAHNSVL